MPYLPEVVKVLLVAADALVWMPVHPSQYHLDVQLQKSKERRRRVQAKSHKEKKERKDKGELP